MYDLVGYGGVITMHDRPAGTLKTWKYGIGTTANGQRVKRVWAEVVLSPIYRRMGVSGIVRVVLDPRTDAAYPARLTLEGPVVELNHGEITLMPVTQIDAEPVSADDQSRQAIRARLTQRRS